MIGDSRRTSYQRPAFSAGLGYAATCVLGIKPIAAIALYNNQHTLTLTPLAGIVRGDSLSLLMCGNHVNAVSVAGIARVVQDDLAT